MSSPALMTCQSAESYYQGVALMLRLAYRRPSSGPSVPVVQEKPRRGRPRKAVQQAKRPRLPECWYVLPSAPFPQPPTGDGPPWPPRMPKGKRPRLPEWLFSRDLAPRPEPVPRDRSYEAAVEWSAEMRANPPAGVAVIELSRGLAALVDEADHAELARVRWQARDDHGKGWYAQRTVRLPEGRRTGTLLHRVILGLTDPEILADHRNGNGLDNRRENLRPASRRQNLRNSRPRSGTSRFKGVSWESATRKWRAQIYLEGRQRLLGRFASEVEAARAYDRAALEAFGAFARVNLPADQERLAA